MPYGPTMGGEGPTGPRPEAEAGQNALLPRNLFGDDVKPGDTITLKVSAVYGDEVEVLATSESEIEPEENEAIEPPDMSADEEFEAAAGKESYGSSATMG